MLLYAFNDNKIKAAARIMCQTPSESYRRYLDPKMDIHEADIRDIITLIPNALNYTFDRSIPSEMISMLLEKKVHLNEPPITMFEFLDKLFNSSRDPKYPNTILYGEIIKLWEDFRGKQ